MEDNKIEYIPFISSTKNEVEFEYIMSITLSAMTDRQHLSFMQLRRIEKGVPHPRTDEVVQSGIAKYRDSLIPKHVHEDLATGKCKKVVLNYVTEGYHNIDWDYVSTIFGIKKSKIIWLTSIWNPKQLNSESEVTVIFNNFWERFVYNLIKHPHHAGLIQDCPISRGYKQQIQDIKDLKIRKYHGLNYNRQPHIHRAYILARLKQEGLLDRTAYSWGGQENVTHEIWDDDRIEKHLETGRRFKYLRSRDEDSFREILKSKPVTFPNEELKTNKANNINFDHISTSYFQIINETHVENTSRDPYLSEKSYKSFLSGTPFVMWGNAHSVRALGDQSYNCFDKWIDQSYDRIENDAKRLEVLMTEIKRLYAISPEEWSVMLKEMLPHIEHNREQLNLNVHIKSPLGPGLIGTDFSSYI